MYRYSYSIEIPDNEGQFVKQLPQKQMILAANDSGAKDEIVEIKESLEEVKAIITKEILEEGHEDGGTFVATRIVPLN